MHGGRGSPDTGWLVCLHPGGTKFFMILNHKGGWWIKERPKVEEAEDGDPYKKKRHRPRRKEKKGHGKG